MLPDDAPAVPLRPFARGRSCAALALLLSLACCHPREPAHPAHIEPEERGRAFVERATPARPELDVPLLAISVANDDGTRSARVTPLHIARSVVFANDVFRSAGVRFRFDPRDFLLLRSSTINGLMGSQQAGWREGKRMADEVAGRYPDRLVVFFRHGPGAEATGQGFSWTDFNFVVMPGWLDDFHCGHEHISALAHELGHHLGLLHTFASVFDAPSQAAAFLAAQGDDPRAFDGDALLDTAPDPAIRITECLDFADAVLNGVRVPLSRRNVMSYYDERDSLSEEQIRRLRWFLLERRAHHLKLPKNQPAAALEAERLEVTAQSGGSCALQAMDGFGIGNWSAGQQLFCRSAGGPQSVRLKLPVESSGLRRIELYLTRAPDFGIVEVFLDQQRLGSAVDTWAPAVLASGVISLGEHRLDAGVHELSFIVRAKNPAASAFHLGIDAIALTLLDPTS